LSRKEHPALDDLQIPDYIRWDNFEVAWDRVASVLTGNGLPPGSIETARAIPIVTDTMTALRACDGTDAVRVLSAATHYFHPRGISAYRIVDTEELLQLLRVSYDLSEIEGDQMFWQMKRWERANARYPLLRRWRSLDPLGVVWDQRYWEVDLASTLKFLDSGEPLAAFKTDLDNFKAVNDLLGHAGGDEAIRLYCSILKRVFEKTAEVYRRGGDEVIALAPGLDRDHAEQLAEKLRSAVESEFREWGGQRGLPAPPTASIGLVLANATHSVADLVRLLDEAQGEAKRRGKNCVVCVSPE
jgi:diguanylate cyclase (GGDEF)-like protein